MSGIVDHEPIGVSMIESVASALSDDRPVRQRLPGDGVLNMDRLLPFLCVYRRNPRRADAGTQLFVTPEAAYLCAPGGAVRRQGLRKLIRRLAETITPRLGALLILEVWSEEDHRTPQVLDELTHEPLRPNPAFRIVTQSAHRAEAAVVKLETALRRVKIDRLPSEVTIDSRAQPHPPGMQHLISEADAQRLNCHVVGLEIRPIYRNALTDELYQAIMRKLRRGVGRALQRAFFAFALNHTNIRPQHYYVLGRRSLPQQVWTVDRQLAEVSSQFKFLLLTTPVNAERSWRTFVESGHQQAPQLQYRPLECDPLLLKRKLLGIRTERIEDPTLAHVFQQTQDELDRQITMLADIGTKKFLPGSLQVFGDVAPSLVTLAETILQRSPRTEPEDVERMSAREFTKQANREIQYYHRQMNGFTAKAMIRDDTFSGLLSIGGNLLIGRDTLISKHRCEALLQHEVGTHLVTYYNGAFQPLRLLKVGLAGYDGLQEGLAVLSEYLVGGLGRARLRTLAARVIATRSMTQGLPLPEVFQILTDRFGFEPRVAYTITLRVFRGGGLTKDAMYLQGLVEVLDYLRKTGDMEPLLVGKIAVDHIPIVRQLLLRGVLRPAPLRPRWLDHPLAAARLAALRSGKTVLDLLES